MKKGKFVLVLLILLLVAGAAGAAWVLHPRSAAAAAPPVVKPVLVKVGEITTNLADGHFVQASLTLQIAGQKGAALYKKRRAAVEDRIIATLRGSTSQQLSGGKGMTALGDILAKAVDGALGAKDVLHVYFTKLVVQ